MEKRATGGGGEELSEKGQLLEKLIEISDEVEHKVEGEVQKKRQALELEKVEAQNMRVIALERYGETRKRMMLGKEDSGSKKRRSGDVMD